MVDKKADFFTIQVKGQEDEGFYVVITEGPFEHYEEAQEYAAGILEDVKKEDPDIGSLTWH